MASSAAAPALRQRRTVAIGTALSLLLCFHAAPALTGELASMPLEDLLAMEVSGASRFAQATAEAPAAVSVITREQIRDHAWHTLADLLDAVPGLFVTTDRTYRYLGVRGFLQPSDYNANVLLLIDGIPANDALYRQAYLGSEGLLDLALVERVEFIPGPGSSVYGSNAILGVINVVTTTGRRIDGAELELSGGNLRHRGAALRYGTAGGQHDLLVSASGWRGEGASLSLPDTPDASFGRVSGLEDERGRRALVRHAWKDFLLLGAWADRRRGYASAPFGTVFGDPDTFARDRQLLLSLAHQAEWRPALSLLSRLTFGAADYRAHWAYPPPEGINRDDSESRWWGAELQATDLRFARHTLIYGLEYRNEYRLHQRNADVGPDGRLRSDDRRDANHLGLYAQDEWRGLTWAGSDWRLNAGLRVDRYSSFGTTTSPRLAIIQHLSPVTALKYLFGTAYRAPNAYEMHYGDDETMKPNPGLRPERVRSLELALEHLDGRGFKWRGSIFHNRIRDLIAQEVDPEDEMLVYRNRGSAVTRGVVVSVSRSWSGGGRVALSSSWHQALDGSTGDRLPHTPRTVNKADLTLPVHAWRATIEARHLGRRPTQDDDVGGQFWANLALVSVRPVLGGARFAFRIDNLFDRRLHDPASEEFAHHRLPREGRTARATLTWAL